MEGSEFGVIVEVSFNVTSYTDNIFSQTGIIWYRIQSFSSQGYSLYSNEFEFTSPPALNPPQNFRIESFSHNQISISWDDCESETEYILERSSYSTSYFSRIYNIDRNTTTFTDDSYISDRYTYYYRIKAINDERNSEYSQIIECLPHLNPPTSLEVVNQKISQIFN